MANRHHGKLGDVWKHLPLAELLAVDRPMLYGETHAGSAVYQGLPSAERRFGVFRFLEVASRDATLSGSRYATHLRRLMSGVPPRIPGSPAIAMAELGSHSTYLLCDVDSDSTADLERWAAATGVGSRVATVTADGMRAIARRVLDGAADPATTFVHVDPYDPHAQAPGSVSALDLTRELLASGVAVMYWYGYDRPDQRAWAQRALRDGTRASLWCGDTLVTTADGETRDDGDLGTATTPGTGCGVVCANVSETALGRCDTLGHMLATAYAGTPLPSGDPGALDFRASVA